MRLFVNQHALKVIYSELKHNENKMFWYFVSLMNGDNKAKCIKEDVMRELAIKQEKTYYNCRKTLVERGYIAEDEELIDTVIVNNKVIKNVTNA